MAFLVRKVRKAGWVGESRSREAAVQDLALGDRDTDGLTVFEVKTPEDRMLVAMALSCARRKTDRVDLLEVPREVIERFGPVHSTPEHGTTPLAEANRLHCSLTWKAEDLRKLALHLFEEAVEPISVTTAELKAQIASLSEDEVTGEEAKKFVRDVRAKVQPR